jgi:hypothetical protein
LARYGLVICFLFVASETKIDARHRISIGIRANVPNHRRPDQWERDGDGRDGADSRDGHGSSPPLGGKQLGPAGDESI